MGTLSGKSPAATYKSLVKIADEANGLTSALSDVEDGQGQSSSVKLSTNKLQVTPNTNTTSCFAAQTATGTNLLTVDATNSAVKAGTSQTHATTNLVTFSSTQLDCNPAGTHFFVPLHGADMASTSAPEVANGTGTDPATSYDGGSSTDDILNYLFYVPSNIVIDQVKAFVSTNGTNAASIKIHLNSYTIGSAGDSSDGNLTSGAEIAAGNATNVTNAVIRSVNCGITGSSSVTSGKVLAAFVENETNTEDVTITIQILYHFA